MENYLMRDHPVHAIDYDEVFIYYTHFLYY